MDSEKFTFSLDLLKAEEDPEGRRFIYGIASSEALDQEDAIIEASGLKKSADWFVKHGIIDWNHRTETKGDPGSYIGLPIEMKWDDRNRAHLKAELFKGIENADKVWKLATNKQAKLGLSVGGKILEQRKVYDPSLKKSVTRISKVFLNHIAVTPTPTNLDTCVGSEPYVEFMKSLTCGSSISDADYLAIENLETEEITPVREIVLKALTASGNPPQVGTGGVMQGSNVQSRESLEATPAKPKTKKRTIILNKNIEVVLDDENNAIEINTNGKSEVIRDPELSKSHSLDSTEKIVSVYLSLLKAIENGLNIQDMDNFLLQKSLNRQGRRIIKRHIISKVQSMFSDNPTIQELCKSWSTIVDPLETSKFNAEHAAYVKDGVVYSAYEDPSTIPIQEASTTTQKQYKYSECQVRSLLSEELKTKALMELEDIQEYLNCVENKLDDENVSFEKFNAVREAYGIEKVSKEQFMVLWENDQWLVRSIIGSYNYLLSTLVAEQIVSILEEVKKQSDNDNQVDKVTHMPVDTMNFTDKSIGHIY
jgi:hypothetical protein